MFNIFNKNKFEIVSPGKGILKSITDVKDEVFSSKVLGDGFIVEPTAGEVYSPVDGVVEATFPTKHAIGIKCSNGMEILVHIGVDTVKLNGEGFELFASNNQKIKAGQLLLKYNIEEIKSKVPAVDIIVIFSSGEECEIKKAGQAVNIGEKDIVEIKSK
jgi:glucose-specific phosphotransferase system IIA component